MTRTRHPIGLYVLFFTEMWERFGFYAMSALFALYMEDSNNGHPFLQRNYAQILGYYLGFVYFTPFFGGIIADRVLGYRLSVIIGGIMLAAGYFLLAWSPLPAFFAGLAMIILGNGLFKPNISTMVGKEYAPNDPRLDSAYTIFYMGINVGALSAPLVAGPLARYFRSDGFDGYYAGFVAAGVGMIISVAVFIACLRWLVGGDGPTRVASVPSSDDVPADVQRRRHLALLIIFAVVILFWMAFKQNAGTLNFWFKDHTVRTPQPWLRQLLDTFMLDRLFIDQEGNFNKTMQSAINPLFVILFSPLVAWFWVTMRNRGQEPPTPVKIALGMLLATAAFVLLALGGLSGGDTGRVSGAWLVGAYAILTLGELCLSPMGLSLVSKLAAPRQRSMWMGGWFAATAIGGYLSAAVVGDQWKVWKHSTFFWVLAGSSFVAFLVMLAFLRLVNRAMPNRK